MENVFIQYAEVQQKIKKLEEEKRELSNVCLAKMKDEKVESIKNDLGVFTIVRKNKWTYSDEVKEIENDVKKMKAKEEKDGTAEKEISEILMFRIKPTK